MSVFREVTDKKSKMATGRPRNTRLTPQVALQYRYQLSDKR